MIFPNCRKFIPRDTCVILLLLKVYSKKFTNCFPHKISTLGKFLLLNDTHRENCFTQYSPSMAAWLLQTFFICLHNQLTSTHSIITYLKNTDVWKMWFIKKTVKMNGCSFQQVCWKIRVGFCLNTGKRFF